MKIKKIKEIISYDFKKWDESIKKHIDYVSLDLITIDSLEQGKEELYFSVCFKESEKFQDEKKIIKKIERILKTKKIQFFYSLPF